MNYKAIVLAALVAVAGTVTALPQNDIVNDQVMTGTGPLTPEIIIGLIGHEPAEVRIISYSPQPVERWVTWEEFTDALAQTSLGGEVPVNHPGPCIPLCGSDTGRGILNALPFCDNSSTWTAYQKALPAGSSYLVSADTGSAGFDTCGGFYGPTMNWDILQTSWFTTATAGPYDGGYATIWDNHADGYMPGAFGPGGSYNFMEISGPGVRTTLDFGAFWFDYFLGNGAELSYF